MFTSRASQQVILAITIGVVVGCSSGLVAIGVMAGPGLLRTAFAPSPTTTYTATRVVRATITLAPTASRTPTYAPLPTATPVPPTTQVVGETTPTANVAATITRAPSPARTAPPLVQHFLVGRPVALSVALNNPLVNPDPVYLYGTTELGQFDVHHGEEFENPIGTPLYAVADGAVVVAGSDTQPICGDDENTVCGRDLAPESGGYYGKLVVIQLDQTYQGQRVFALYGHMNKFTVAYGDKVKQGDPIGEIGMSGVALGPHVHFEIRLGENDYAHTRNPILWMTPLPGRGSLAGRFLDSKGAPVRGAVLSITSADGSGYSLSTETYSRDRYPAVNSDDDIGENFAMSDLPPGDYIVRVNGQQYAARVTIQAGALAFVELGGP